MAAVASSSWLDSAAAAAPPSAVPLGTSWEVVVVPVQTPADFVVVVAAAAVAVEDQAAATVAVVAEAD